MKPDSKPNTALHPAALVRRACARPFARNQHGAVAVEFALLALPFFAIIGAILETSIFFLSSQILDSAVDNSVRLLRTGQAQTQNYTIDTFRTSICDRLYGMFDCDENSKKLHIEVDTTTSFANANFGYPLETDSETGEVDWTDTEIYTPGIGSEIVTVRVYYKWPIVLDIMGFNLSNTGDGHRLMAAVRVFKNEPFGGSSS